MTTDVPAAPLAGVKLVIKGAHTSSTTRMLFQATHEGEPTVRSRTPCTPVCTPPGTAKFKVCPLKVDWLMRATSVQFAPPSKVKSTRWSVTPLGDMFATASTFDTRCGVGKSTCRLCGAKPPAFQLPPLKACWAVVPPKPELGE